MLYMKKIYHMVLAVLKFLFINPIFYVYFKLFNFPWENSWRIIGFPILFHCRKSEIHLGKRLVLRSSRASNSIGLIQPVVIRTLRPGSSINIGNDVGISGSSIVAMDSIVIKDRVLIGSGTLIIDNDLHPIGIHKETQTPEIVMAKPITIESDVFIGARAIILKGVTIGCGSIVGAGSVVTKNVPPHSVVGGNPARLLRKVEE
jgi:acetyltransferase-like isoleucine patch superfamily enzyme